MVRLHSDKSFLVVSDFWGYGKSFNLVPRLGPDTFRFGAGAAEWLMVQEPNGMM